ncbi:hypothetical protein [Kribbella sp. NBC_00889]|uniref:hypothetical protein n=1 Tax=Kribbella sp. NBC_00889 TaxID=2975974 RepID=UPI00386FC5BD|nr:hypothetical protein OG817_26275 [Kribbella sp. NBC_00889]
MWKAQVSGSYLTFAKDGTPPNHIAIYPRIQYRGWKGDTANPQFSQVMGNPYEVGKSYLFLRHQLSGGHSSLVRQKLSVDNYPADTPSVG